MKKLIFVICVVGVICGSVVMLSAIATMIYTVSTGPSIDSMTIEQLIAARDFSSQVFMVMEAGCLAAMLSAIAGKIVVAARIRELKAMMAANN